MKLSDLGIIWRSYSSNDGEVAVVNDDDAAAAAAAVDDDDGDDDDGDDDDDDDNLQCDLNFTYTWWYLYAKYVQCFTQFI